MLEYISLSHANFEGKTASLITLPMTRQKLNTSSLSGMKSIFCKQAPVNGVGDKEDSRIKAESWARNLEETFFLPSLRARTWQIRMPSNVNGRKSFTKKLETECSDRRIRSGKFIAI